MKTRLPAVASIGDPTKARVVLQQGDELVHAPATVFAASLDADTVAIAALTGTGIATRIAADTWALRTLAAPAAGLTITNPAGVAGNPTFALANDLSALEGLALTGIAVRTAADTWSQRQLVAPATGITVTNPAGVAGDITLVLANDLAAVEGLASTGLAARTAADTWAVRTLTAGAAITVANGDGVSGNPTISIADDAISYAKLQNVSATSRVLGRKTALAGDAEEVTLSELLDFVGSAAQGDILYRGVATWTRLGAGTSGQFLQTLGAGANPAWATSSVSTTYGAIGTYVYGYILNNGVIENTSYAGSAIQPAGVSETSQTTDIGDDAFSTSSLTLGKGGVALSGTWRSMGRNNVSAASTRRRTTLFLRIS